VEAAVDIAGNNSNNIAGKAAVGMEDMVMDLVLDYLE